MVNYCVLAPRCYIVGAWELKGKLKIEKCEPLGFPKYILFPRNKPSKDEPGAEVDTDGGASWLKDKHISNSTRRTCKCKVSMMIEVTYTPRHSHLHSIPFLPTFYTVPTYIPYHSYLHSIPLLPTFHAIPTYTPYHSYLHSIPFLPTFHTTPTYIPYHSYLHSIPFLPTFYTIPTYIPYHSYLHSIPFLHTGP